MHHLEESLDRTISSMIVKNRRHANVEHALVDSAHNTVDYIQSVGKRGISDAINRRLVILKNLAWESQHELVRGPELSYFFSSACDVFEKRFDYSTYICEFLLHATGASPSYAALEKKRFRDLSFILARLFLSEVSREKPLPKRLHACLNVLAMLEQDASPSIKNLIRMELDQTILFAEAERIMQEILASFEGDPRHFALRCSLLPTSLEKSEKMFLSVVQLNEIIFSLWTDALRWILGFVDDQRVEREALEIASRLCQVAQMAIACIAILNDFTHEEFLLFRDFTANAGAIQSRKYKELELYTSKHVEDRIQQKAFDTVPYLKDLSYYTELHLYNRIKELADDEAAGTLKERLIQFEKTMMDWKRFHLHIARSRLLNHGVPDSDKIDHYLSSSIKSTFRSGVSHPS